VLAEAAATDPMFGRVLESLQAFRAKMTPYINIAERAMLDSRG
jgi:TRAP-type mannitol/chloroaromatic compound transport system substrate-binding protein